MPYRNPNFEADPQSPTSQAYPSQQPAVNPVFQSASQRSKMATQQTPEQTPQRQLSPFEAEQRALTQGLPAAPQGTPQQPTTQAIPVPNRGRRGRTKRTRRQATPAQPQVQVPAATDPLRNPALQTIERRGTPAAQPGMVAPQLFQPSPQTSPQMGSPTATPSAPGPQGQGIAGQGFQVQSAKANVRQPPIDIHDAGDELEIEVELPGVSKKNIRLTGRGETLSVRAVAEERETTDLIQSERDQRVFEREIPLGFEVDAKQVSARFKNGVLTVKVPNEATRGQQSIDIK